MNELIESDEELNAGDLDEDRFGAFHPNHLSSDDDNMDGEDEDYDYDDDELSLVDSDEERAQTRKAKALSSDAQGQGQASEDQQLLHWPVPSRPYRLQSHGQGT